MLAVFYYIILSSVLFPICKVHPTENDRIIMM